MIQLGSVRLKAKHEISHNKNKKSKNSLSPFVNWGTPYVNFALSDYFGIKFYSFVDISAARTLEKPTNSSLDAQEGEDSDDMSCGTT
jgi:hypothetical protein